MCGVYQVAAFLTNNKHILTESNFENHFLFLKIFCSNYGITTFPDISRRVVHEHEVSWPGLHLVNSPFWWSLYFCMRRIGQCASTRPSFRVVFLKSQQEVVDSERIRILSTRSPAMEDISVCQRREILQMIQKILLRTGRSFFIKSVIIWQFIFMIKHVFFWDACEKDNGVTQPTYFPWFARFEQEKILLVCLSLRVRCCPQNLC